MSEKRVAECGCVVERCGSGWRMKLCSLGYAFRRNANVANASDYSKLCYKQRYKQHYESALRSAGMIAWKPKTPIRQGGPRWSSEH